MDAAGLNVVIIIYYVPSIAMEESLDCFFFLRAVLYKRSMHICGFKNNVHQKNVVLRIER